MEVLPWWSAFEPSRALAVPEPRIFASNSFHILDQAQVDADVWRLGIFEMCALALCAFGACARFGIVDRFSYDQRLQLYTNRKLGILHRHPLKVAEFLEQEGVFQILQRSSFTFVKKYLTVKVTRGFDWLSVDGLDRIRYT